MGYLIGYEIGSDKVKAALVNAESNKVVATLESPAEDMPMLSEQKGWAEQDPDLWWSNVCHCTKSLLKESKISSSDIISVGIAYQMHGLVLVDDKSQPIRPSIIWCDSRAVRIGEDAMYDLGVEFCFSNLLNSPGNFTASKLKWVKDNEPERYKRISKILLPGDYIAYKMTGALSTTVSGLSEGIFWNFKERRLATEVLDYFGFDHGVIPEVKKTFEQQGVLSKKAAKELGLKKGIPLTYRAGDQPNNALSLNVLNKGDIAITSSNSGVVYGVVEHLLADPKSRVNSFAHVNYEEDYRKIGILMCLNGAGSLYAWVKQNIARQERSYDDMERILSSIPIGANGVCVLPFGNGAERILGNKTIDAHIHNLQFNKHSRAHIYRAAIEGVAFAFVYGLKMLQEIGLEIKQIRVGTEDMFRSRVFTETISTLLGKEIQVLESNGAIGAALASGVSAGIFEDVKEAVSNISIKSIHRPSLDYAKCSQAYSYWLSILNKSMFISEQHADSQERANKIMELTQSLEQKNRLIEGQAMSLREHAELKENIISIANQGIRSGDQVSENEALHRIVKLMKKTNSYNKELLESHFEIQHDPFIKRLVEVYPLLAFEELKLCHFIRSKYSTKEISGRMSLSLRGTETKRYRLRKKLGIERGVSLATFIQNF